MTVRAAPTLHTDRLVLRAHRPEDLDASVELWTDPAVVRYTLGKPVPRPDVWTRLLRHAGHWSLLGFGYWLAFDRETDLLVGEVGFGRFKRAVLAHLPEYDALPEAGWVLHPRAHGKGLASEAVGAVLAWRDAHLPRNGTFCLIHPENAPSLRLAARFGFAPDPSARDVDPEWGVLRRP